MRLNKLASILLVGILTLSSVGCSSTLESDKEDKKIAPLDNTYDNIIACRKGDEETEKIKVLKKVLTSNEARYFINNEYKGTVIPTF